MSKAKKTSDFALYAIFCQNFASIDWGISMAKTDNACMKIGKIVRQLRKELQLSQEELAFRIGTDAANLSRIENDKQNPAPEMMERLATTLGFPLSQIYLMVEQSLTPYVVNMSIKEEKQLRQRLTFLVSKYMMLDENNQELLLDFMTSMLKAQEKSAEN